jgi:hypothetical protein
MKIQVWYDGVFKRNIELDGYYQLPPFTSATQVIAFNLTNCGSWGGLLASTNDGSLITNPYSWKCINTSTAVPSTLIGWESPGYANEYLWVETVSYGANIQFQTPLGFCQIPLIESSANWIWTGALPDGDKTTVLCRVHTQQPCDNTIPPPPGVAK